MDASNVSLSNQQIIILKQLFRYVPMTAIVKTLENFHKNNDVGV